MQQINTTDTTTRGTATYDMVETLSYRDKVLALIHALEVEAMGKGWDVQYEIARTIDLGWQSIYHLNHILSA